MSHIVSIETKVRDLEGVQAACRRLQLPEPILSTVQFFNGEFTGLAVELPDWKYAVVCDVANGQVHYDNYQGAWGNLAHLNKFLQIYAVEVTRIEARKLGHSVSEKSLPDGSIKLLIEVEGGTL